MACDLLVFFGVLLTGTARLATFPPNVTMDETKDGGKRGMHQTAMTVINPKKEYWASFGLNKRLFSTSAWHFIPSDRQTYSLLPVYRLGGRDSKIDYSD